MEERKKQEVSQEIVEQLQMVYDNLKVIDAVSIAQDVLYTKQRTYEHRDKPGRQLTRILSDRPFN